MNCKRSFVGKLAVLTYTTVHVSAYQQPQLPLMTSKDTSWHALGAPTLDSRMFTFGGAPTPSNNIDRLCSHGST